MSGFTDDNVLSVDVSIGQAYAERCLVVDPVCAFDFGHSLNALNYFSQLARSHWHRVEAIASYHLPKANCEDGIARFFDFYYDRFIGIKRKDIKYNGFNLPRAIDPLKRAYADYSDLFFYKNIGRNDSIILPNADIYSLLAILTMLDGIAVERAPKLYIRLIGVMEYANYFERDDFSIVVHKLRALRLKGSNIAISAETPTLARLMSERLGCKVWTTPYPLVNCDMLPLPDGGFTILCGGSARGDKGFSRLPAIINLVNANTSGLNHFVVQNAPPKEQISHVKTIVELSKIGNVTLLDGVLPFAEIVNAYACTSLSMMPYDPAVYANRGSAILMESIMFGRLVVGQADTAFAEQIMLYNSGETARTDDEFAKAIVRLSSMPKRYLEQQAASARQRYTDDVRSCYQSWLGDLI